MNSWISQFIYTYLHNKCQILSEKSTEKSGKELNYEIENANSGQHDNDADWLVNAAPCSQQ